MVKIKDRSCESIKFGKKMSKLIIEVFRYFYFLCFSSYCLSGPNFIQPSEIPNREQLIVISKCCYEREVVKRDGPSTQVNLNDIQGKCSVLSLKHFCTRKFFLMRKSFVLISFEI